MHRVTTRAALAALTSLAADAAVLAPGTGALAAQAPVAADAAGSPLAASLDRLFDRRHEGDEALDAFVARLAGEDVDCAALEEALRAPRQELSRPSKLEPGRLYGGLPLRCEHVDYETTFLFYLPKGFDPEAVHPLFFVGHGGNGAMRQERAVRAAAGGVRPWMPVADRHQIVLVAPLTERGWGAIGNSILVSTVSLVRRWVRIDPDRVYVTGHSMGGHLSWRTALTMADRFAGVAPMSGGYDYVERGNMPRLWSVPGYATFGEREPYGIADHNRKMRDWIDAHGFDHWRIVEKQGGHEIFADELPAVARFLLDRPRDPYRDDVYVEGNRPMAWSDPGENPRWNADHTWVEDRPLQQSIGHWLEILPRPDLPDGERQRARATIDRAANRIDVVSSQVRRMRVRLHPEMVDFEREVLVSVNGDEAWKGLPEPDPRAMLEHALAFDDRGRIYHAVVDLEVATDAERVPRPGD